MSNIFSSVLNGFVFVYDLLILLLTGIAWVVGASLALSTLAAAVAVAVALWMYVRLVFERKTDRRDLQFGAETYESVDDYYLAALTRLESRMAVLAPQYTLRDWQRGFLSAENNSACA